MLRENSLWSCRAYRGRGEQDRKKTRRDKFHLKPTNITVVVDTELQDPDVCQNIIDPGPERVVREKAIVLDCSFDRRKPYGPQ